MANETIHDQGLVTSAAAGDEIALWVVASNVLRRITKENFLGAALTGGGTIVTGGFTLTVPATGTAALLATANTFTKTQTINTTGNDTGVIINMATGNTDFALRGLCASTARFQITARDASANITLNNVDFGNDQVGPSISIGRNTSAGAAGPTAGALLLFGATSAGYLWLDDSNILRIHTAPPTGNTANATRNGNSLGTIVGAQTSSLSAKHVDGELSGMAAVLARIHDGAQAVRGFTYKSGAFQGARFEGVVVDYAPAYGMDRDTEHPAGKSLNEVNILGDLLRAVAYLTERVTALETELAALRA